jgi:hypothetical protein
LRSPKVSAHTLDVAPHHSTMLGAPGCQEAPRRRHLGTSRRVGGTVRPDHHPRRAWRTVYGACATPGAGAAPRPASHHPPPPLRTAPSTPERFGPNPCPGTRPRVQAEAAPACRPSGRPRVLGVLGGSAEPGRAPARHIHGIRVTVRVRVRRSRLPGGTTSGREQACGRHCQARPPP